MLGFKKSLAVTFLFLSILFGTFAEGVLERPRKTYVVKTAYFDIMFPEESKNTAKLLADNADSLYEKAKQSAGAKYDFRMPVIISPDSDQLSVSYTSLPYNRVIIFDAVPGADITCFEDTLLSLFYREVFLAVAKSIRSPLQQFIAKTFNMPYYQPVALINLPFTVIEGLGYLEEGGNHNSFYGRYNDGYFLQILSQAKMEGKFPGYFQASVTYDIYPGDELMNAVNSAFIAYLMQAYGYEKFEQFWTESGAIHPYLYPGIIYIVYGKLIKDLWADFEASIPLPDNLEQMKKMEYLTSRLFENDPQGLYQQLMLSPYGIVWYDDIRHEVDIFDTNGRSKIRQLLFFADDVDRMTLSADGRYITISFTQIGTEDVFKKKAAWIYDLKERTFLDYKFRLRDASLIKLSNGENAIAGISGSEKIAVLQVYSLPDDPDDSELLYQKKFQRTYIPSSIVSAENGKFAYLLSHNNCQSIVQINLDTKEEKAWQISDEDGEALNIRELRLINTMEVKSRQATTSDFVYTFQYVPKKHNGFTRMGYISLNSDHEPEKVLLQSVDLYGGVYYPVIQGNYLYYCSKKLNHNELCYIPFGMIDYTQVQLAAVTPEENEYIEQNILFNKKQLEDYELSKYSPLGYMFPLSVTPFFAIRKLSVEKGTTLYPGLGLTLKTHSDPFMNNKLTFSAAWTFLKLDISQAINASSNYKKQQEQEAANWHKDKSFAFFLENTSTPVDINAGALFNFNLDGEYHFEAAAGTAWQIPMGMNFSFMKFNIQTNYSASTDYYDSNLRDTFKSMSGWPNFKDAYQLMEASVSVAYTNIHQYGISPYEKFGVNCGARMYSIWDAYQINKLNELRDLSYEEIKKKGTYNGLTQAQVDANYDSDVLAISQFNTGLFASVEIPRLNPLHMIDGWVLSLPSTISAEFLNSVGTALETKVEILLAGKEIHNGFSPVVLYFSRMGLKAGYDLCLDYDTETVPLPDMRRQDYLGELLSETYVNDNLFAVLNMDFSSPIGGISSAIMSAQFKAAYYPRTQEFIFNIKFIANF